MRLIYYLFVLIVFFSCSDSKKEKGNQPTKLENKKVNAPVQKKIKKGPLITQENVIEKLTKYGEENPESIVDIYTTKGKIRISLYDDTPLHRANFILLVKSGYLKGCLFSRVVKNFMAQCGGSYDEAQRKIQDSIGSYNIPSEISRENFHKKGTLGMARSYTNNPNKNSECDEFYFVEGTKYSSVTLDHYEELNKYKYNREQRNYYQKNKGAAHIDGEHTVFGVIIDGYNVVSKLTHVETDSQDWPVVDMYIDSAVIIK